jgi:hypothetical protein
MDQKHKQQPKQGNNEDKRKQMDKNMPDHGKTGKSNNDPDTTPEIGDDPETTKKKIPNMHK